MTEPTTGVGGLLKTCWVGHLGCSGERGEQDSCGPRLHSGEDRNETTAVPCPVIERMTWKHAAHTFRRENDLQLMESGNIAETDHRDSHE